MPDIPHLIIPYATSTESGCQQALQSLRLPHLDWLLTRLTLQRHDHVPSESWILPHERVFARAVGVSVPEDVGGSIAWAAWHAHEQGLIALKSGTNTAWAFVTPCHWEVGIDHITMHDPAHLHLTEADSCALLKILAPWFQGDGIALTYDQPARWLAQGSILAHLPTPSLERVIGRDVRHWIQHQGQQNRQNRQNSPSADTDAAHTQAARTLQRLHSELQMLLYTHPFNDAREAQGLVPINAFWLHGAGPLDTITPPAQGPLPQIMGTLCAPAQQENWGAWANAWAALDAGPLAQLQAHIERGGMAYLTLCGEESAFTGHTTSQNLGQKILRVFRPKRFTHLREQL